AGFARWFGEMLELDAQRLVRRDVRAKVRFPGIGRERRAAAAGHDLVQTMRTRSILISLDPVLIEMLMPSEQHPDVMLVEERHPLRADGRGFVFDFRSTVRAGRKWRVVEEHRDMDVTTAVEPPELRFHPRELRRIVGNVRVDRNEERIAVAERVRRIS